MSQSPFLATVALLILLSSVSKRFLTSRNNTNGTGQAIWEEAARLGATIVDELEDLLGSTTESDAVFVDQDQVEGPIFCQNALENRNIQR